MNDLFLFFLFIGALATVSFGVSMSALLISPSAADRQPLRLIAVRYAALSVLMLLLLLCFPALLTLASLPGASLSRFVIPSYYSLIGIVCLLFCWQELFRFAVHTGLFSRVVDLAVVILWVAGYSLLSQGLALAIAGFFTQIDERLLGLCLSVALLIILFAGSLLIIKCQQARQKEKPKQV
jgi:hypothetical protein